MTSHSTICTDVLLRTILSGTVFVIPMMAGAIVGKFAPLLFGLRLGLILALFMALSLAILAIVLDPCSVLLTD